MQSGQSTVRHRTITSNGKPTKKNIRLATEYKKKNSIPVLVCFPLIRYRELYCNLNGYVKNVKQKIEKKNR